jgi:hypothetical protein
MASNQQYNSRFTCKISQKPAFVSILFELQLPWYQLQHNSLSLLKCYCPYVNWTFSQTKRASKVTRTMVDTALMLHIFYEDFLTYICFPFNHPTLPTKF